MAKSFGSTCVRPDDMSMDDLKVRYNRLLNEFEQEQANALQLRAVLREYQTNLDRALLAQANIEEDLFEKTNRLNQVQIQLTRCKHEKSNLEDRLAHEVVEYTKETQKWSDRERQLSEQKRSLEQQLRTQRLETQIIREENSRLCNALKTYEYNDRCFPSLPIERRRKTNRESSATPKHLNKCSGDDISLANNQTEIAVRECNKRIDQYKREMSELQAMNARLVEENQEFQLLLAEKTVMGAFSVDEESLAQNNTLASELEALDHSSETESDEPLSIISSSNHSNSSIMEPKLTTKASIHDQFRFDSLQNQNHALRLSLERLVGRLLDYREFEHGIENRGNVHQRSISEFYERVFKNQAHDNPRTKPFGSLPPPKVSTIYQQRPRAGLAIRPMIFNNNSIDKMELSRMTPEMRIPSYGIDSVTPSPRSSASELSELSTAVSPTTVRSATGSFSQDSISSPRPSISSQQGLKPLELEKTGEETRKISWSL